MAARERRERDNWMAGTDFARAVHDRIGDHARLCVRVRVLPRRCPAPLQSHKLSTEEAFALIDRFTKFGSPILVFTGGDPMMRRDLFDLIEYADQSGLGCSLAPTATALPNEARLRRAKEAGVRRIALSLYAVTPQVQDDFRKVRGSWERTMAILRNARTLA